MKNEIIDISPKLNSSNAVVWPGHPQLVRKEIIGGTGTSTITKLTMSSHTGSHIDGQKHITRDGKALDSIPLVNFIGKCRVLDFTKKNTSVTLSDITKKNIISGERILLKTKNSKLRYSKFVDDYVFLESNAAKYLAKKNIKLIGIDALSIIDYKTFKDTGILDNVPHSAFLNKNIPILEGIDLTNATEGEYFLSALPLNFDNIDGSPVRAVLLRD